MLQYIEELGAIRFEKNSHRLKRSTIGSFTIFSQLKGKGYIACYIQADIKKLETKIKLGQGIESWKVFTPEEAKEQVAENSHYIQKRKAEFLNTILERIEINI